MHVRVGNVEPIFKAESLDLEVCVFVDNHISGGVDTFLRTLLPRLSMHLKKIVLIVNANYPNIERVIDKCPDSLVVIRFSSIFQRPWFTRVGCIPRPPAVEKLLAIARRMSEYALLPNEILKFRRLGVSSRARVLVVNGGYPGSYSAIAAAIAFSKEHPTALNVHNFAVKKKFPTLIIDWLIDRLVAKRVQLFIGVSHLSTDSLKDRISSARLQSQVIYNAVEIGNLGLNNVTQQTSAPQTEKKVIGLIGTIEQRKGHFLAIEILAHLHTKNLCDRVMLRFVGSDPFFIQKSLSRHATTLGVSDSVAFVGYVENPIEKYSGVDVVIVPSLVNESFGLVPIEALSLGIPVIASSAGALPEILQGMPNCTLIANFDVESWANALELALKTENNSSKVMQSEKLTRLCNPDRMASEYLTAIFDLEN